MLFATISILKYVVEMQNNLEIKPIGVNFMRINNFNLQSRLHHSHEKIPVNIIVYAMAFATFSRGQKYV